jgi:DnaJ-class molecular chaperone
MYAIYKNAQNTVVAAAEIADKDAARLHGANLEAALGVSLRGFLVSEERAAQAYEQVLARKDAEQKAAEPCHKCGGSGEYHWGWDGQQFTRHGLCFDCKGKGHMDLADVRRDAYYHDHIQRIPAF